MSHAKTTLEEIRTKVRSSLAAVRQPFTASFFNLPNKEQLPSPGDARNWDYADWKRWANPFDITVESRSTHAYILTHTQFHTIFLSLPTTSGDFRAGMAGAREIRLRFLTELERLAVAVSLAIDDILPQVAEMDPADATGALKAYVVMNRYDAAFQKRISKMMYATATAPTEETTQAVRRARNLLDKVTARSGESPRVILRRAISEDDNVETVLEMVKNALPMPADMLNSLVQNLEDQIEALDVMEEEAKAAKQREREAREREKNEKALVSATGAAGYQSAILDFRGEVAEHCRLLTKLTEQHSSQIIAKMRAIEKLSAEFPFPAYPTDQIKELLERAKVAEQATAVANEKLAEALMSRDEYQARVEALTPELEKLRKDHNAALALFDGVEAGTNWREKFADLVARLTPLLASDNFLTLASNMVTARNMLKTAHDSIPVKTTTA